MPRSSTGDPSSGHPPSTTVRPTPAPWIVTVFVMS